MISKEKLVEIIKSTPTRPGGYAEYSDIAGRILLALENERVKELVLWEGLAKSGEAEFMMRQSHGDNPSVCLFPIEYAKVKGKRGKLIFREQEGK